MGGEVGAVLLRNSSGKAAQLSSQHYVEMYYGGGQKLASWSSASDTEKLLTTKGAKIAKEILGDLCGILATYAVMSFQSRVLQSSNNSRRGVGILSFAIEPVTAS